MATDENNTKNNQRMSIIEKLRTTDINALANITVAIINVVLVFVIFAQYRQQTMSVDRVWSAEQIALIYEEAECCSGSSQLPCRQPKANVRSREDAVRAYIAIEGHRGKARLPRALLSEMVLRDIDLSNVDLTGANFIRADLTGAKLESAILSGAQLQSAILKEATLIGARLTDAHLEGADLSGADLRGTYLERAVLGVCDNPELDLATGDAYAGANLSKAKLQGATFNGAYFCGVDLTGADLTGAIGLDSNELARAKGDDSTILPRDVERPKKWIQ